MIKCKGNAIEFEGMTSELLKDFSMIVLSLIETLVKNTPLDTDEVILLMEKFFKLGVKSYFDFKDGENDEE